MDNFAIYARGPGVPTSRGVQETESTADKERDAKRRFVVAAERVVTRRRTDGYAQHAECEFEILYGPVSTPGARGTAGGRGGG